jgi:putative DNA primase/helicase
VFSDARLDERANLSQISERLLSITGEDVQDINRKYKGYWSGTLGVRLVLLSNELPRFKDESGALASRFVMLRFRESFYGKEDTGLTGTLLAELPGILNWAIDGWERLRKRGAFVQPGSGKGLVEDLQALGSNILCFVRERCELAPNYVVGCDQLFQAWKSWNNEHGIRQVITSNLFSGKLTGAFPSTIHTFRPRDAAQSNRPRHFAGIKLRSLGLRLK